MSYLSELEGKSEREFEKSEREFLAKGLDLNDSALADGLVSLIVSLIKRYNKEFNDIWVTDDYDSDELDVISDKVVYLVDYFKSLGGDDGRLVDVFCAV